VIIIQPQPPGTTGYYMVNATGQVYGFGGMTGWFGNLHDRMPSTGQPPPDPSGTAADIATSTFVAAVPSGYGGLTYPALCGYFILDTVGNVYGFGGLDGGGSAPFPGFGTLSQHEPAG